MAFRTWLTGLHSQENMASGTSTVSDIPLVHIHHFEQALQRVAPSVSKKDQRVYDALRWQLRSSRGHLNPQASLWLSALHLFMPVSVVRIFVDLLASLASPPHSTLLSSQSALCC